MYAHRSREGVKREQVSPQPATKRERELVPRAQHPVLKFQRQLGNRCAQRVLNLARQGETEAPSQVEAAIERARGQGQALDQAVRAQMESAFGEDFAGVRVHADPEAHALASRLEALAFTTERDIFFAQGTYSPGSSSGRALLAHELAHVVQQKGAAARSKLTIGGTDDHYEREAEAAAQAVMNGEHGDLGGRPRLAPGAGVARARVQRLSVPLRGWGGVPRGMDDSSMDINPELSLWVGGQATERRALTGSNSVMIPLNTDGEIQVAASVSVFKDNPLLNETNDWYVAFKWQIRVDERGRLTLSPPRSESGGGTGDAPWFLDANPSQDATHVGIALTLRSTESTSRGNSLNIGGTLDLKPFGVGGGVSGGYSRSWGSSPGSTLTLGRGFIVELRVPAHVEVGPVTIIRRYPFYFATGRATLGVNPATGEDEDVRLTAFLRSLDPTGDRGAGMKGVVEGYASPLGDKEANRALATRRTNYILNRVRAALPRADFVPSPLGADIWLSEGVPAVDNSERHRVVFLEIQRTQATE